MVERRIGSAEVTGPTPVASLYKLERKIGQMMAGLFLFGFNNLNLAKIIDCIGHYVVKYKRNINEITDIWLNYRQEKNKMNKGFKMFAVMALLICAMFITPFKVEAKTVKFTDSLAKNIEKAVNKYNIVTMEQISKLDFGEIKSKSDIKYKFNIKKQLVTMEYSAKSILNNTKIEQNYIITKNLKTGKVKYKENGPTIPLTDDSVKLITNSIETGAYKKMSDVWKKFLYGEYIKNKTEGKVDSGKLTLKTITKLDKIDMNTLHSINDKKKLPEKVDIKLEGMEIHIKNIKFSK